MTKEAHGTPGEKSSSGNVEPTDGKDVLKRDQQQPDLDADSEVDEKFTHDDRPPPGGLEPNSIVRN